MKKIILLVLVVVVGVGLLNFKPTAKEDSKLVWHTNMVEAVAIAKKENKPMFLFFTGSDWCGWCIRLQKEVFKTPEFEAWAKEKVVLVELDFPRRTPQAPELQAQNNHLQQIFSVRGYPTVWFVKANTTETNINFEQLGSTGYGAGGPKAWLESVKPIMDKFVPYTKEEKKGPMPTVKK